MVRPSIAPTLLSRADAGAIEGDHGATSTESPPPPPAATPPLPLPLPSSLVVAVSPNGLNSWAVALRLPVARPLAWVRALTGESGGFSTVPKSLLLLLLLLLLLEMRTAAGPAG